MNGKVYRITELHRISTHSITYNIEPAVTSTTGHIINLTNIMPVLKEVADLKSFCEYASIPKEMCDVIFSAEETEQIGCISSCLLEMKMSWSQMKEVLLECDETKAADIAELMKQYICKGVCIMTIRESVDSLLGWHRHALTNVMAQNSQTQQL